MRWAPLAAVLLGILAACSGDRYDIRERKIGDRTELVRIDRVTGKTDVLRRTGGTEQWVPVEETAKSDGAATATPAVPQPTPTPVVVQPLPRALYQNIVVSGSVTSDGVPKLVVRIANRSEWTLKRMKLEVKTVGITRIHEISLEGDLDFPAHEPIGGLAPQDVTSKEILLLDLAGFRDQEVEFLPVAMMGYPPAGR